MKISRLITYATATSSTLAVALAIPSCVTREEPEGLSGAAGTTVQGSGGSSLGFGGSTGGGNATGGAQSTTGGNGSGSGGTPAATGGSTGNAGTTSSGGVPNNCTNVPPEGNPNCDNAVEWGWCEAEWIGTFCQEACGVCTGGGSGGSGSGSGGTSTGSGGFGGGGGQPPLITDGTPGYATRYWDCCKPACGWDENVPGQGQAMESCGSSNQSLGGNFGEQSACQGGGAYMCYDNGPWAVSDTLSYGFTAINMGGDYCGKCFQLQFTGSSHSANNDPGSQALNGKTMIVMAISNGGVDSNQFDLLIPGGGVGDFDACSNTWGQGHDLGVTYGGFYLDCQQENGFNYEAAKNCADQRCQTVFGDKPDLLAGCNWFIDWFGAPDNPNLVYKEIDCPAAIEQKAGISR